MQLLNSLAVQGTHRGSKIMKGNCQTMRSSEPRMRGYDRTQLMDRRPRQRQDTTVRPLLQGDAPVTRVLHDDGQ